ncbi:condensation domain-containing protein, partial [Pseudoalteromonas sp. P1-9]|uniref:condensation domain-containing protein n=1 Tax=Pseudoalteromonas sp. P1-9 TaxID=1710354 RepID=UPI000A758F1E
RYYETLLSGEILAPIETDWTYRNFVALEQDVSNSETAKQFFIDNLGTYSGLTLPKQSTEYELGTQKDHRVLEFNDHSAGLAKLAKKLGMPLQSVLLAGHMKVMSLLSGEDHTVTSVTVNGRPEQEGAEQSLGLYLNSLPLAVSLAPSTWSELISNINEIYRQGMSYRRYPLNNIQQALGQDFGEVSFNYTYFHVYGSVDEEIEKQGLEVIDARGFEQTNYGLVINMSQFVGTEGLGLDISFDASLYSAAFIERLGEMYVRVYQSLLADL